jgi:hypothetical protein
MVVAIAPEDVELVRKALPLVTPDLAGEAAVLAAIVEDDARSAVERLEARDQFHRLAADRELRAAIACGTGERDSIEPPPPEKGYVLVKASTLQRKKPTWLWPGRIAFGVLNNLEGDPGLGKTTLLLDVAARVTRGLPMPAQTTPAAPPAAVILLTAEDDPECVLRPRLEASGADLARVHFLTAVRDGKGRLSTPSIPRDVERIGEAADDVGARLLIVDPPAAYLGGDVDAFKDSAVRRALAPLQEMAAQKRLAVVFNRHFNKGSGGKAIYRGGGSIAFAAAARAVLHVYQDPDDESRRLLAVAKCNLAPRANAIRFQIVSWAVDREISHVLWEGETDMSADDILGAERESGPKGPAIEFLKGALAAGPRKASELYTEAEAAGLSVDKLKRAKQSIGVKTHKDGTGPWMWSL